jgi:trans-aconitate methyltransferase
MTEQQWHPQTYSKHAEFVSELGAPLIDLLSIKPGGRVLDLGCGDGRLTQKLVDAGYRVTAVDSSAQQIEAAKSRGINAFCMNACELSFDQEFEAVFTNAALHWITDTDSMLFRVGQSLVAGGQFVGEFGGKGNVNALYSILENVLVSRGYESEEFMSPKYFPSAEEFSDKLECHGFTVESIELFERPTPLSGDIANWYQVFAQKAHARIPETKWREIMDEIRDDLRPLLYDSDRLSWVADYVRLRFSARKMPLSY